MSRSLASWHLLEGMMLELKKSGVTIPLKVVEDLRVAKSMIELSYMEGSGDVMQKAEVLFAVVEAYLVAEGQKRFGAAKVDGWLRQLESANAETSLVSGVAQDRFVTGIPKDQHWIRIEPVGTLTAERIGQLAEQQGMQIKPQNDGKLVVYGSPESLKGFIKKVTTEKL
jgi:hypothetical protein